MNKLFHLLIFFFIGGNIYAQGTSAPKYLRDANIAFESGKYFDAIDLLKNAYDKDWHKRVFERRKRRMCDLSLAEAYRLISRYRRSQ